MHQCQQCGLKHEKKGLYCSKKCCDKAYRERKKGGVTPKKIKREISPKEIKNLVIPKETGPKLKWCMYCGNSLEKSHKLRFCSDNHERRYWECVKNESHLKIIIDPRTIIVTKKYNKVQELIESIHSRQSFTVLLS